MEKEYILDLDKYLDSNTNKIKSSKEIKVKKKDKVKVKKKDEEKELLKLVKSLKDDVSNLYEYSSKSSSNNDWPNKLIYNIIAKISYLKGNFNSLTNEEIKELKNSLEELLNIYDTELFGPLFCVSFIGFAMAIVGVVFSVLFSTWWFEIILLLITPLFLKFKVYPDLKEDIRGEAFKKFDENIKDIKKLNKELAKILEAKNTKQVEETKEIHKPKTNQLEDSKAIKEEANKEYTLVNLINNTKRNIMMLNNSDEPQFNERLALALKEYSQDLDNAKGMPNNMKKEMEYFASTKLTKELKSINEDVLKLYQVNKKRMQNETIDKLINDYISNIDDSKDKVAKFINLKNDFNSFLDNEDILSKMQIEERLAQCFYYTIKDFNIDDVKSILDLIDEDFYEAFTIFGEELINEREDNLEIMAYYNKLKKLKNDLDSYTYLLDLCLFLIKSKVLKLKYFQSKNNVLNKELNL